MNELDELTRAIRVKEKELTETKAKIVAEITALQARLITIRPNIDREFFQEILADLRDEYGWSLRRSAIILERTCAEFRARPGVSAPALEEES